MKTWLKGGLWGLGIGLILFLLIKFTGYLGSYFLYLTYPFVVPLALILNGIFDSILPKGTYFAGYTVAFYITVFLIYPFIGILIGWVLGRYRSRVTNQI